jgi:hypothetical protein
LLSNSKDPSFLPVYVEAMAETSIGELTALASPWWIFRDSRVLQFLDQSVVEDNVIEDHNPSPRNDMPNEIL